MPRWLLHHTWLWMPWRWQLPWRWQCLGGGCITNGRWANRVCMGIGTGLLIRTCTACGVGAGRIGAAGGGGAGRFVGAADGFETDLFRFGLCSMSVSSTDFRFEALEEGLRSMWMVSISDSSEPSESTYHHSSIFLLDFCPGLFGKKNSFFRLCPFLPRPWLLTMFLLSSAGTGSRSLRIFPRWRAPPLPPFFVCPLLVGPPLLVSPLRPLLVGPLLVSPLRTLSPLLVCPLRTRYVSPLLVCPLLPLGPLLVTPLITPCHCESEMGNYVYCFTAMPLRVRDG